MLTLQRWSCWVPVGHHEVMPAERDESGVWREETFFKPGYPTAGVLYELVEIPDAQVGDRLVLSITDGSEITAVAVEIETHVGADGHRHQVVNFQFDPPLEPEPSRGPME